MGGDQNQPNWVLLFSGIRGSALDTVPLERVPWFLLCGSRQNFMATATLTGFSI